MSLQILGIDPGSQKTGYGIIRAEHGAVSYVESGLIRLGRGPIAGRIATLITGMEQLLCAHQPQLLAMEDIFLARNVRTALRLGQVQGALMGMALRYNGMSIEEYAPRLVKKTITGSGGADKQQVSFMVQRLLSLQDSPAEDAADALAVALCAASHGRRPVL